MKFIKSQMIWIIVLIVISVGAAIVGKYVHQFGMPWLGKQDQWGQFGDYVGGLLNPVLSFAAFTMLLITYRHQVRNSEDNHFFELVKLTHEAASSVVHPEGPSHSGIRAHWNGLKEILPKSIDTYERSLMLDEKYGVWRSQYWEELGSYFESVLFVLRQYVIDYDGSDDKKIYFMLAVRAQMSMAERNILFYEMIHSDYWHKFAPNLYAENFWRGSGDVGTERRKELIDWSVRRFSGGQPNIS